MNRYPQHTNRYPALRFVSKIYLIAGVIIAVVGLIMLLISITAGAMGIGFITGAVTIPGGVGLVAISDGIMVFIDIEATTRETKAEIMTLAGAMKANQAAPIN